MSTRVPSAREHPALVGSFALLVVFCVAVTAAVVPADVTVSAVGQVSATPVDARLSPDASTLTVEVALENPAPAAIVVPAVSNTGDLHAYRDGERIEELGGVAVSATTVPPGGTATTTLTFPIQPEHRDGLATALAEGRVTVLGTLDARVVRADVDVTLERTEVSTDG